MIPKPYIRIEDASCQNVDGLPVSSPEMYMAWQAQQIMSRRIARLWKSDAKVEAHIRHGRWLVKCVCCPLDVFTHPEWRIACCGECGAAYRDVQFPDDYREIERALLERPQRETQNWEPGETLADLLAENAAHGVTQ